MINQVNDTLKARLQDALHIIKEQHISNNWLFKTLEYTIEQLVFLKLLDKESRVRDIIDITNTTELLLVLNTDDPHYLDYFITLQYSKFPACCALTIISQTDIYATDHELNLERSHGLKYHKECVSILNILIDFICAINRTNTAIYTSSSYQLNKEKLLNLLEFRAVENSVFQNANTNAVIKIHLRELSMEKFNSIRLFYL